MRGLLLTPGDIFAERALGEFLAAAWGLRFDHVPTSTERPGPNQEYDAKFFHGERLVIVAELKRRHLRRGQYPTIVISAQKVRTILARAPVDVLPLFVVETDDAWILWTDLRRTSELQSEIGGRFVHRRDEWDVEQCFYIPVEWFEPEDVHPIQGFEMADRHSWCKLRPHTYICRKCGCGKVNDNREGVWITTYHLPTGKSVESRHVPPCEVGPKTKRYLDHYAYEIRMGDQDAG